MNIRKIKIFSLFILVIYTHFLAIISDILIFSPKNETIDAFNDIPAEFGSPIPINGILGYVVHAYPAKACSPIYPPPINMSIRTPWFVLIERNGCDFDYKVLNAQRAGYSLAIVYNFESDSLIPMHGYRFVKEIEIPSVFIGWSAGIRILKSYTYHSGNYLKVTEDLPFNLNNYLLPFAIVIAICFLIMLVFIICKFVRERRYRMRNRLTARNLKSIPVKKYQAGDTTDVCAVCLEDYNEGDKLRILPCSHAYHSQCIDPWLTKSKRSCPVCKRKIVFGKRRQRASTGQPKPGDQSRSATSSGRQSESGDGNLLRFLFPGSGSSSRRRSSLVTIIDVRSENDVTDDDDDDDVIFVDQSRSSLPVTYVSSTDDENYGDDDDDGDEPSTRCLENRSLLRSTGEATSSYGTISPEPSRNRSDLSKRINNFLFGRNRDRDQTVGDEGPSASGFANESNYQASHSCENSTSITILASSTQNSISSESRKAPPILREIATPPSR